MCVCVSDALARGETLHISIAELWLVCCLPVDLEEILPNENKHVTKQLNVLISRQRSLAGEMPDKEQI